MPNKSSLLHQSVDAVIFDCDGTLSAIEGIDVLAEYNSVAEQVKIMTAEAMGETGLSIDLYEKRLSLVRPSKDQMNTLANDYINHLSPGTEAVIQALQHLKKPIYIVSAGLYPSIVQLGHHLHVPRSHIFAVNLFFDDHGNYIDFDHASPLVMNEGKRRIVTKIKTQHPRIAYIGDGLNDLAVKDLVTRFIGYGGAYYHQKIEAACEFYLRAPSLLDALPYLLTEQEFNTLY